jgi:hypothetical protein
LKEPRAQRDWDAQDDPLRHAKDLNTGGRGKGVKTKVGPG